MMRQASSGRRQEQKCRRGHRKDRKSSRLPWSAVETKTEAERDARARVCRFRRVLSIQKSDVDWCDWYYRPLDSCTGTESRCTLTLVRARLSLSPCMALTTHHLPAAMLLLLLLLLLGRGRFGGGISAAAETSSTCCARACPSFRFLFCRFCSFFRFCSAVAACSACRSLSTSSAVPFRGTVEL